MYLLDTSVVSDIVNDTSSRHAASIQFIQDNRLFEEAIFISLITLGELKFGVEIFTLRNPPPSASQLAALNDKVKSAEAFSGPLEISKHVVTTYAKLRAAYAKGIAPKFIDNGKLKSMPPERWAGEALSASQLQITENDIWIAAIAVTYDFVLVTGDKDYLRIAKHFPDLRVKKI
jgi:predicted nucleic acid-binding protein